MSRRESCVWHPMPDEVRRSSVQSRRASLAAGRRKSMNTNAPDWEVEAPPTPTRGDYTPRDDKPVEAAAVSAEAPAAAATPAEEKPAAQPAAHEEPAAAAAAAAEAEAEPEPEAAAEDDVASVKSAEPSEVSEDEEALKAVASADAEAVGRGRTRHIVRFHGEKWAKVLRKQRPDIEAAFLEDIKDCAGVEAEEAQRLKIKMHDCMEVTFVVYSDSRARQKKIHSALQEYKFPHTCHLYTNFSA